MKRSAFFKQALFGSVGLGISLNKSAYPNPFVRKAPNSVYNIKTSLNAYSFNSYLQNGRMDLDGLVEYCSQLKMDAVDITGYYFPNYPKIPKDEYIYHIKKKDFTSGLAISGTGIRNNFIDPDPKKRADDIELVKRWIIVASKLGAPVIRVFAAGGGEGFQGRFSKKLNSRLVKALVKCVHFAKAHGVMIGLQNHNNYLKNADQVLEVIRLVDSKWFGIVLDVGSFSTKNPYNDIARVAPYAVNWQIKENLGYKNRLVKTNLNKIVRILRDVNYRGFIPIETLGNKPKKNVPKFLNRVIGAIEA
jgi:sugar phosphate isomerase/epimerase